MLPSSRRRSPLKAPPPPLEAGGGGSVTVTYTDLASLTPPTEHVRVKVVVAVRELMVALLFRA